MDWILFVPTLIADWLIGNRWRYAPLLLAFLQVGWFFWGIENSIPIALLSVIYASIQIRNFVKWSNYSECRG